jgi:hypothetical protein
MHEETGQEVLDSALELLIKIERGQGPSVPAATWLCREHRSLNPLQTEQALGRARGLLVAAQAAARAVKEGAVSQQEAVGELIAAFKGFSIQAYRLALAWGLYSSKRE